MKMKMTIDECLEFADQWSRGMTIHEDSRGWRVVCMLLAEEVRAMRQGEFICGRSYEVSAAVEREREKCAQLCEQLGMSTNGMYERNHDCAAAIRALKYSANNEEH